MKRFFDFSEFTRRLYPLIKPFIKRNLAILLSFLFPPLILEIAYITCGIFPFGKYSLLIIDLYHQYAPFISDLRERLRSFSSLLYSWTGGLGTNYLPLYAYYLASPLNLITVLFPKNWLTEAVLVLTLLKVGLAGACFACYLRGVRLGNNAAVVAFSLLYALSGYVLAFSWNIMWLDVIYLLPLVVLGLVRLVRDGRGIFFCVCLALTLFSNFYMAIFVCIFLILYYPVCLFQYHGAGRPAFLVKRTAQFAGFSILSAGLSAILLLPSYFSLKLCSAADDAMPRTLEHYFDLFDYIARHFTAAPPSIREGMPNLYCGIIVLILIPAYFLCGGIRLKEKLLHLLPLSVLIAGFNLNIPNFIWHGFHFPNQIPYRFSFVYIFLVLSISCKAFGRLNEFSGKQIGAICMSIAAIIILSQKLDILTLEDPALYISLLAVILYAAALTAGRGRAGRAHPSHGTLLVALVIISEVAANTIFTMQKIDSVEGYSARNGYSSGTEAAQIRSVISKIASEDKSFYRMELIPPKTVNDPYLYNYRGLSVFSSPLPMRTVKMPENLGYHSNSINSYIYEGSTAFLDSLFGVKYLVYRSMNIDEKLYARIESPGELAVFKNPYALSLGFEAPVGLKDFRSSSCNPFEAQNKLIESICGVKDVFIPIEQKQGSTENLTFSSTGTKYYSFKRNNKESGSTAKVQITVENDSQVYLYFKAPYQMKGSGFVALDAKKADFNHQALFDSQEITESSDVKKVDFNPRHSTLINLGFCKAGSLPELQLDFDKSSPESGRFEVYAYALDLPAFEKAIGLIKEKSMTVESFTDTSVIGRIEAASADLMVMSIPYDKGWRVWVDGRKAETQAIGDFLLCFEISAGPHRIELRFVPEKFYLGLSITLISAIILLLLAYRNKRTS